MTDFQMYADKIAKLLNKFLDIHKDEIDKEEFITLESALDTLENIRDSDDET